jgi:hypothetical protein
VQILPVPSDVSKYTDLEQDRYRVRVLQDVIRKSKSADHPDGDAVLFISETRKPTKSRDPWANGLAELMGSARLGYAVDYALLYGRMTANDFGDYYASERSQEKLQDDGIAPIMLSLEKGRDGMTRGRWAMEFHFRESKFEEIEALPVDISSLLVMGPVVPPTRPRRRSPDDFKVDLSPMFDSSLEDDFEFDPDVAWKDDDGCEGDEDDGFHEGDDDYVDDEEDEFWEDSFETSEDEFAELFDGDDEDDDEEADEEADVREGGLGRDSFDISDDDEEDAGEHGQTSLA